ncbi:MAG: 50S ribosomal protein L16 [Phycisphaerae bacterium]|nr:50S ribosomal protein L16 [Phycisphaerae bacterium]|tara:strand:+ start:958 stop:1419 length:462 start_codon:yes stop_codon:yes gene_type:complete
MIRPKKIKFIKNHRGNLKNTEHKSVVFFPCALPSFDFVSATSCYLTSLHLEVAVKIIKKKLARKGILRLRIFPDKPFTSKSIGSRIGKGKGAVSCWKAKVKPGIVIFSVSGVPLAALLEALLLVKDKIPCSLVLNSLKSSATNLLLSITLLQW